MSIRKRFVKLTSIYLVGEIIIMAGGFLSFPILTRILTKQEYGVMNLISMTIMLVALLFSAGLRHSSQRFYAEYEVNNKFQHFYSTIIYTTLFLGILGTISVISLSKTLLWLDLLPSASSKLLAIASFLVGIRLLTEIVGCLYRVREKANIYALFAVLTKYAGMLLSILFVFHYSYGLTGYYSGLILGEVAILVVYAKVMIRDMGIPKVSFSFPLVKEMVQYGFPLILTGFAGFVLRVGDHYLIGYFLSAEDVAMYSVPYNLCSYITDLTISAFQFSFIPMIMNQWATNAREGIEAQVRLMINIYFLVTIPAIFGISVLGEKLIVLLASSKYAGAHHILPYIVAGEGIKGLLLPLAVGLQFFKKTKVIALVTIGCALLNVCLNIVLIPILHLLGAAISTLLCYCVMVIACERASSKYFYVPLPWKALFVYICSSAAMSLGLIYVSSTFHNINVFALILIGICLFFLFVIVIDVDARDLCRQVIKRRRQYFLSG